MVTSNSRRLDLAPIVAEEHAATIKAMQPPKRERPVVAVIGQNEGAEVTEIGIPVSDGVDEISLALVADVYSRTRQSIAVSLAEDLAPVTTRAGLRLLPDYATEEANLDIVVDPIDDATPLKALDIALNGIEARYDRETAAFIALQMEYAWSQPRDAGISD